MKEWIHQHNQREMTNQGRRYAQMFDRADQRLDDIEEIKGNAGATYNGTYLRLDGTNVPTATIGWGGHSIESLFNVRFKTSGSGPIWDDSAFIGIMKLGGGGLSANREWALPDNDGVVALTSDLAAYLPLAGGGMSGDIGMGGNDIDNCTSIDGATMGSLLVTADVDVNITAVGGVNITTGGGIDISLNPGGAGAVNVNTSLITNVSDPTAAQHAATKAYVDGRIDRGTSFPGAPVSGQVFVRTDLGRQYIYDGARWRTTSFIEFQWTRTGTGITGVQTLKGPHQSDSKWSPFFDGVSTLVLVDAKARIEGATVLDAAGVIFRIYKSASTAIDTITITATGDAGIVHSAGVPIEIASDTKVWAEVDCTPGAGSDINFATLWLQFAYKAT